MRYPILIQKTIVKFNFLLSLIYPFFPDSIEHWTVIIDVILSASKNSYIVSLVKIQIIK